MSPCLDVLVSMSQCPHVSMSPFSLFLCMMSPCLFPRVSMSPSSISMSPCLQVYMSSWSCLHVSGIPQTENETNGQKQIQFVFWKRRRQTFVRLLQMKRKTEVCSPWSAKDKLWLTIAFSVNVPIYGYTITEYFFTPQFYFGDLFFNQKKVSESSQ
jgi:hypothetical protein